MRYREFKYIKETSLDSASTPDSEAKYIAILNQMIARGQPIIIGKDGTDGSITPIKNHPPIKNFNDIIQGTEDGEPAQYQAGKVYKGAEFGGPNRGNVAEGLFGIAIYDTLKNGVSHNRLTDSIQLGCIALASPMDSYIELSKVCLIGKDFSKLLNKAILENGRLCSKYEALRPEILERFSPKKNLLLWEETIKALDKNLEIVK